MPLYNYHSFPYAGIAVPSESPFFPTVSFEGEDTKVRFNQGYVINYESIDVNSAASIITVTGMNQTYTLSGDDKFYVKIDNSGDIITAAFLQEEPSDTGDENIFYIKVCEFDSEKKLSDICLRENIHWKETGGGETIIHPWKITRNAPVNPNDPEEVPSWNVRGDIVYSNNGSSAVGDATVTGSEGYVLLKITRNESSRAMEAVDVETTLYATLPDDTYTDQYVLLGYISGGTVEQLAFETIRIHELMIVNNGEFMLAPLQLSSNKIYQPPA